MLTVQKKAHRTRLFVLGMCLGMIAFLCVYGISSLNVANDTFCRGGYLEKDIQQHYAGWLFYRNSALSFPLGVTKSINAPQGVSVAYTDSIPLVAVLLRPLANAWGGTFQYFGWFTLVCLHYKAVLGLCFAVFLLAEPSYRLWGLCFLSPVPFSMRGLSATLPWARSGLFWPRCTSIFPAEEKNGMLLQGCFC